MLSGSCFAFSVILTNCSEPRGFLEVLSCDVKSLLSVDPLLGGTALFRAQVFSQGVFQFLEHLRWHIPLYL